MATADEILATMAEEAAATDQMAEVCTIDRCTRAVTIPEALRIVGVETDKDVTRRVFRVLCSYRGTNLSTFRIRIHFRNANKEPDIYYVKDAAQDGEYLTFSWVISRNATKYKGKLQFIACMVCDGGTDEEREWNSTLGEFTVLEGLEVELTDGEEEQARDAITQLLAIIDARESEAVEAVSAQGATRVAAVRAAGAQQEASIAAKGAATLETIPDDYATLYKNVQKNAADILMQAPAIVETATGSIVTVTDSAARPAVELISNIEPVEGGSGDPSPDNVRPISGWDSVTAQRTGENLVNVPDYVNAGTNVIYEETLSAFAGLRFAEGAQYTVSMDVTSEDNVKRFGVDVTYTDGTREMYWIKDGASIARSVSTDKGRTVLAMRLIYDTPSIITMRNVQVERGGVATSYKPYQGQTLTASLPETVYGGKLNWTTGVVKKYFYIAYNGTNTFFRANNGGADSLHYAYPGENVRLVACSHAPVLDTIPVNQIGAHYIPSGGLLYLNLIGDGEKKTKAEFDAMLAQSPVEVVYEVENPEEIQIAPQQLSTLKGINNVWSSAGETELSYIADTKMYIDNKLAAIAAAALNM